MALRRGLLPLYLSEEEEGNELFTQVNDSPEEDLRARKNIPSSNATMVRDEIDIESPISFEKLNRKNSSPESPHGFTKKVDSDFETSSLLSGFTRIKKIETARQKEEEIEKLVQERLRQIFQCLMQRHRSSMTDYCQ